MNDPVTVEITENTTLTETPEEPAPTEPEPDTDDDDEKRVQVEVTTFGDTEPRYIPGDNRDDDEA